ncbi:MAG: Eco57I restriction-modification methylase domain-containing protein [Promethearchaeota archaeon]
MVLQNKVSKNNRKIGQIFTPSYIAEFMVNNILRFIESSGKKPQNLRVLEPSVGEGIFLKFLIKNDFSNITAYEMDYNLKESLINSYPTVEFKFENFLGSDFNEKYDLILGNPPYLGQNYNAEIFQKYMKKYTICDKYFVGNMDLFYYFIHLGIEKLNPNGILSFLTTNYWITKSKKTGIKLLKPHILNECYLLQYIDLSHLSLFEGAKGQHNCIFVLQKKTDEEKIQMRNKKIQIIHVIKDRGSNQINELFNKRIFKEMIFNHDSKYIRKYKSALTNYDLREDQSWNLIYPSEIRHVIDKIEQFCNESGKLTLLKDLFIIRNGIISINDEIFILKKGKQLKIENNDFYIQVNGTFIKLTEIEKKRLKKLFKSKSIKPYGYSKEEYIGYMIYFNKNEFKSSSSSKQFQLYEKKYPTLIKYLKQYERELRNTLINAKENPENFYFPRRGSFIRSFDRSNKEILVDLEPFYDNSQKIFFKFISDKNIFGYSNAQYYATSDTYFLWARFPDKRIDHLIILAYLNSKLMHFIFHAKSISIKRSKTKLEYGIPIPNIKNFNSEEKRKLIELIKIITFYLIKSQISQQNIYVERTVKQIRRIKHIFSLKNRQFQSKLINAIINHNKSIIKTLLDSLIFQLFDLDENKIEYLLKKYYSS